MLNCCFSNFALSDLLLLNIAGVDVKNIIVTISSDKGLSILQL